MPQPRVRTTVVCVVGARAGELADGLGASANCRAVRPDDEADPLDRAVAAWREATRAHVPWLVHDADPLAAVADAYRAFFGPPDSDEAAAPMGAHGSLEVAGAETLARWRAGSLSLPDYYLVAEPERMPVILRHLYLGALHDQRPRRVQPVTADPDEARRQLPRLRAARWWPDLDALLEQLTAHAPDQLHRAPADADAAPARETG